MSPTAVILILVSAFLHAGWNLLTKRSRPSAAFFLVANIVGTLCMAPALFMQSGLLSMIPARVWGYLVLTGLWLTLYYVALAGAYRRGDMSIAYPVARSSPVIVVTVVTLVFGRGEQVSAQCVAGILLVVGGCFILPMRHFRDLRLRNYLNASCLMALCAACGTTGYSITDDEALRILRALPGITGPARVTAAYACLEGLTSCLWLGLFVTLRRKSRREFGLVVRGPVWRAALTGAGIYVTYTLVLIAMAFVRNVSYVVAFRQLSVPLGAILGVALLKEPGPAPKFVGVTIMFVGLVLVGMG